MNRLEIINRVKKNTFDENSNTFKNDTIIDYINEGIDRITQVIVELNGMKYLTTDAMIPIYLPSNYHYLLSLYSTSRCFGMDERHYQATLNMNEFEVKLEELKMKIDNGDVIIVDEYGDEIVIDNKIDYVVDNYFIKHNGVV